MARFCITTALNQLYEIYGSTYRVDWFLQSRPKTPDASIQHLTEFVFGKFNHIDSKNLPVGSYLVILISPFTKEPHISVYKSKEMYNWFVKKAQRERIYGQ